MFAEGNHRLLLIVELQIVAVTCVLDDAPIWHQVYLPLLLLQLAGIIQASVNLFRPQWVRFRSVVRVVTGGIGFGLLYVLLKAGVWIVLANPAENLASDIPRVLAVVNQSIFYGLVIAGLISALTLLPDIRRLRRSQRDRVVVST